MERLAFQREQSEIEESAARTLRAIVLVNAILFAVGLVLGAAAPAIDASPAAAERSLEDGAKPLPGRRF